MSSGLAMVCSLWDSLQGYRGYSPHLTLRTGFPLPFRTGIQATREAPLLICNFPRVSPFALDCKSVTCCSWLLHIPCRLLSMFPYLLPLALVLLASGCNFPRIATNPLERKVFRVEIFTNAVEMPAATYSIASVNRGDRNSLWTSWLVSNYP